MTDNENNVPGRVIPKVSANMHKQISEYRRTTLEGEVYKGLYRDGSHPHKKEAEGTFLGNVVSGAGMHKAAQSYGANTGSVGGAYKGTPGTAAMQNPEMYSPLWLSSNMSLPRDRVTMNAWCRSFYALNPIVQNAINLHSTYPLGKLEIRCKDPRAEKIYNDIVEETNLMDVVVQLAQEYWLLGETFPMGEMNEATGKWSRFVIQNPDYMVVKASVVGGEPIIMMRPDEHLRRICSSNAPADIEQRRQLNDNIVHYVKKGQNIPLDNYYVSHLARRISPYEVHGTGLPVCIFRVLQLFDQIYESKFAQAEEMINPWRIFKLGGGAADFRPQPADLEAWRQVVEQAAANKNYKIFTHDSVTIETVGASAGIYDTSGDIDRLLKFMYAGLMVPQIVIEGGGDITYANGGVSLDILKSRYMNFRSMIAAWLRRKVFAPVAKIHDLYDYENGEKRLILPEIEFNRMNLFDLQDYITNIKELSGVDGKRVSVHTLYYCLGLDWDTEQAKIRKEDIAEAIRKKEKESLEKMSLNELRGLTEDDDIPSLDDNNSGSPDGKSGGDDGGGGGLPGMDAPGGSSPMPDITSPPAP